MSLFKFKEFNIFQEHSEMKVGTDGILLGSWLHSFTIKHIDVLDIGTGTGLLSLMYAQSSQRSKITAVEINQNAFHEASRNVFNSDWAHRIDLHNADINSWHCDKKFDLIITNPPYFTNSYLSCNPIKNLARHQESLRLDHLMNLWRDLGKDCSYFACILPLNQANKLIEISGSYGHLHKRMDVRSKGNKKTKRSLLFFGKDKQSLSLEKLCIYDNQSRYTKEYKTLTKDYYLDL